MPDVAAIIEFGKTFGFPALVVAILLYLFWRAVKWTAVNILLPIVQDLRKHFNTIVERLLKHFDTIEAFFKRVDDRTERIEAAQPKTCRLVQDLDLGKPSAAPRPDLPPLTGNPVHA
jgi:hypothetical protein